MSLLTVAIKYLKKYPALTVMTIGSILCSSFFEGTSFIMLIPLMQKMLSGTSQMMQGIDVPFFEHIDVFLSSMSQLSALSFIFITLFVVVLIKNVFLYVSNILIARLRYGLIRDLKIGLMDSLLLYDFKYFDNAKMGHIISVANNETMRIGDFLLAVLNSAVLLGRVLVYIVLLFFISWKVTLCALGVVVLVLLVIELLVNRIKLLGVGVSSAIAKCNYKLTEILNGIRLIKTCCTEKKESSAFKMAADDLYVAELKEARIQSAMMPLSEAMIMGIIALLFITLLNVAHINITAMFPVVATYLLVVARTGTQLYDLNSKRANAIARFAAIEKYEDIIKPDNKRLIKNGRIQILKFSKSVDFKNVNFCYLEGRRVIDDITLSIPKGKITAIVGPSGAGKSTIINLMLRFYDATSGGIYIDGVDVREVDFYGWRKKIGFVSQDTFIFNTSVADNISYGVNANREDIVRAAKIANAHEFIKNMANGYDTILGERGVKLSGGQKQRISIARAVINNPEILIFDEATSSLDSETERLVREATNELIRDKTAIIIAHRLSTILHADNIIVLEHGRVAECGRHDDLIRNSGIYKNLYEKQRIA